MTTAVDTAPEILPHTTEWHAARATGIGSSDAAAACGLSRYGTPLDVYAQKRGLLEAREDSDAMRLGRLLEPVVKSEWEHRTGGVVSIATPALLRHPEHEWMVASPDAWVFTEGAEKPQLLECKNTSRFMASEWGDEDLDEIPQEYLIQVQHQLCVAGAELCHVAVLIDGRSLKVYRIPRNERLIGAIVRAEGELWERIKSGDAPEPDWTHSRTPDLIEAITREVSEREIELGEESQELWDRQRELAETIKASEKERSECRARIRYLMEDAGTGILPDGTRLVRRAVEATVVQAYTRKAYVDLRESKAKR